jgi:hypothetical protein
VRGDGAHLAVWEAVVAVVKRKQGDSRFGHSPEQVVVDVALLALPTRGRLRLRLHGVEEVQGSSGTPVPASWLFPRRGGSSSLAWSTTRTAPQRRKLELRQGSPATLMYSARTALALAFSVLRTCPQRSAPGFLPASCRAAPPTLPPLLLSGSE